ncbi:hypothetical protein OKA05_04280 [Luteolibacter arcticus]|uniref:Uncharacterized protein n=1 Tax=Luteolibacter arcticus TaxID=1581411 RepID=A0ABT3GDR6_9BACT|nr:hypothetical protein [Luteolibacter arcticus]MCW1921757.1 hypothetical protein [Luteolibacter arcticus]
MKILLPILLLLSSHGLRADESVEPTLHYTLKIGERSYQISEGKPFEVEGAAGKAQAVLQAGDHRVFPYQELVFKYPAYFTFEADFSDPTDKSCDGTMTSTSLSGILPSFFKLLHSKVAMTTSQDLRPLCRRLWRPADSADFHRGGGSIRGSAV